MVLMNTIMSLFFDDSAYTSWMQWEVAAQKQSCTFLEAREIPCIPSRKRGDGSANCPPLHDNTIQLPYSRRGGSHCHIWPPG